MKVRTGFVSNSSSSSFVVVGIRSRRLCNKILANAGLDEEKLWDKAIDHGQYIVNGIDIIWGDGDPIVGLEIATRFTKGHTFNRIQKELLAILAKAGLSELLPTEKVRFYYGEIYG